jgi:hypothetical protein
MHWLAVFCELLGAFLLAAEAIKTDNLVVFGQKLNGFAPKLLRFHAVD